MGATLIFPLLILSFPQLPPSDLLDVDSVKVLLGLAVDTDVHGLSLPNGAEGDDGSSTSAESGRRWAGECRKRGRSGGRGITRPARSAAKEGRGNPPGRQAEPRSGGDGLALAAGGRNRPQTRQIKIGRAACRDTEGQDG